MEEEQIINEELKKNTKQDILCYIGMVVIFIMIFIPPIFRIVFYDPTSEKKEVDVVYANLKCYRSFYRDGKTIDIRIENNYRDLIVLNSKMTFSYTNPEEEISEVTYLNAIEQPGVKKEKLTDGYSYQIDYENNPALYDLNELSEYNLTEPAQRNYFKTQNFTCERDVKTVKEEK